ncbi:MAG TPA: hypothetical protein VL123_05705 [Candidatus Udaeobacter sp.]|jgi:3,4-dihydroxyphenylacetate 2,3-dioxygenase|nr:hypothetical protein [Candidatus Udaeobacter sp.]
MLIPRVLLVPNRPTLVLDQHRGHRTPMLEALARLAADLDALAPQAVVALSARWGASGPFRVDVGRRHRTLTDYTGLGVELRYDCDGDPALARTLVEAGQRAGLRVAPATRGVDSGVTVPLHFLLPTRRIPVVPLSLPPQDVAACRAWGTALRGAIERRPEKIVFIASGLLSFNEHAWNLRREVPESPAFDQAAIDALGRGDWNDLGTGSRSALEKARPDAGLRHLQVLRGLIGEDARGTLLAYESGNGIGAALMEFPAPVSVPAEPPAA